MGKAARLKRERAAGTRRLPDQDAPRPQVGKRPGEPRTRKRRDRKQQGRYDFMFRNRGKSSRPSAAEWMENRTKAARARNGVSRGAPGRMTRRNDPRTWSNTVEPEKGARRASWRAGWKTGAIFRGRLTGKRYVDLDVAEEKQGK